MQKVIALRQLWLFDIFVQCWVIILQICRVSFLCTALCADLDLDLSSQKQSAFSQSQIQPHFISVIGG